MTKFIAGTIFGMVLATIGFSGIAKMATNAAPIVDQKIEEVKTFSIEASK